MGFKGRLTRSRRIRMLERAANEILRRPERFNQQYGCGTPCCIAGHLAAQAGLPVYDRDHDGYNSCSLFSGSVVRMAYDIWGQENLSPSTEVGPSPRWTGPFAYHPRWSRSRTPTPKEAARVLRLRARQIARA